MEINGVPGGGRGHSVLDSHLDWLLAMRHLLDAADLAGGSVDASLAAEMAAVWPKQVEHLAPIAPFGLHDEADPPPAPWTQRPDVLAGLLTAAPKTWRAPKAWPEAPRPWNGRSSRPVRRKPRRAPFGRSATRGWRSGRPSSRRRPRCSGASRTGAAHLAELAPPDEVARAVLDWLN